MLVMFLYIAGSDVTSILHMLVYIASSDAGLLYVAALVAYCICLYIASSDVVM